jgi:hypothetical protein
MPFRFGYAIDVNYTLENSGIWHENKEGRVWKLGVQSHGAYSLNFIFEDLLLPDGAEIYLYNNDRTMVYGPITGKEGGSSKEFGTDLIKGETVIIELFEPEENRNMSKLKIAKAIHGYKNMFYTPNSFGDALPFHNNVNC